MKSRVANEDYIEGVVCKSIDPVDPDLWRFDKRLILKVKTDRFKEKENAKRKIKTDKPAYDSYER